MRRRFALVFNAHAGVAWPRLLTAVLKKLEAAGADVTALATESAEDATRQVMVLAASGGYDGVIAAGGDGTIRAVAAGAAGSALPVGIIPLGTGNVMRFEIGLKSSADDVARTLLEGPDIPIEGGLVNGAPFFLMVGAGFDGRIVNALSQNTKRFLGRLAYGGPITRTLWAGPDRLDVEIDGRRFQASWVIVSNASRYGGSFVLTRSTAMGAAGLVAVVVKGTTRRALLKTSVALALGRLARPETCPKDVEAIACRHVWIGGPKPVPVEIDGDEGGVTPVEIRAGGVITRFIVPAAYVASPT
ncbi:MAG: diacylglycerol kinase family protein [Hyphomicrobium sp.]